MEFFKCYECDKKFTEFKDIISHLKTVHSVRDNMTQIQCVNNFNSYVCSKRFLTFGGLRKHFKKCYEMNKDIISDEQCSVPSIFNDEVCLNLLKSFIYLKKK